MVDEIIELMVKDVPATAEKDARKTISHIVALKKHNIGPIDLGSILASINVNVNLLQLIDCSPRLRTDLSRLIAPIEHGNKGKKRSGPPASAMQAFPIMSLTPMMTLALSSPNSDTTSPSFPAVKDIALPQESVSFSSVTFLAGSIDGIETTQMILDCGATFEAINPKLVRERNLTKYKLKSAMTVSLANGGCDEITEFVIVDIVIGGILCTVAAFVFGPGDINLLISVNWFARIQATMCWKTNTVRIEGKYGESTVVPLMKRNGYHEGWKPVLIDYVDVEVEADIKEAQEIFDKLGTEDQLEFLCICEKHGKGKE